METYAHSGTGAHRISDKGPSQFAQFKGASEFPGQCFITRHFFSFLYSFFSSFISHSPFHSFQGPTIPNIYLSTHSHLNPPYLPLHNSLFLTKQPTKHTHPSLSTQSFISPRSYASLYFESTSPSISTLHLSPNRQQTFFILPPTPAKDTFHVSSLLLSSLLFIHTQKECFYFFLVRIS